MAITQLARITFQDGARAEFIDALNEAFGSIVAEAGTEAYAVYLDREDPNVAWVLEVFTDQHGRDLHRNAETMKLVVEKVSSLSAEPIEVRRLIPIRTKRLPT